jgi:hypothetical protein
MPRINQTKPPRYAPVPIQSDRRPDGKSPDRQSVLDRIRPINFDDSDGIRMMVYGRSGTGKSGAVEENFATVVLDHVTGLQDMVLKEVLGLDEIPIQKSWGLATQQQYGTCILRCKELLSALLSVQANVVLVAQEKDFNTDSEGDLIAPAVGAALTPSLCGWANSVCDYIVNTFLRQHEEVKSKNVNGKTTQVRVKTRKVEYCLRTGPHPVYCTKFRLPKGNPLPESIVDPDYDKIMTIIRGQSAE